MDEAEEKKEIKGSPSQIADFKLCKRRWGWNKLNGLKKPAHPSAELGTRVHDVLEQWLGKGKEIDVTTREGAIAAAGIRYLPAPSKDLEIEQWIELTTDVMPYVGKVDLGFKRNGRIVVHDHKSTGNLSWAKTEEDLKTDPQALIYAAEAMDRHKVDEVDLQWLYLVTAKDKPRAKLVQLTILRDEVVQGIAEHVDPIGAEMLEIHKAGKKALDLEPTISACSAYGGCAYRTECSITVADIRRSQSHMEERKEGALEKLKREKAERAAAAGGVPTNGASAAAAPVVAPITPPTPAPAPSAARKPAAINPPEAPTGPRAAASIDLSPLVAAVQAAAAKLAPRDLRDELLLALARSGNLDLITYEVVDDILKGRGGK